MINKDVYKAFLGMHPPMPKERPPMTEGKEHLEYRAFPPVRLPIWEWMKSHIVKYEFHQLAESIIIHDGTEYGRGQVWVHPDALIAMMEEFKKVEHILFTPPVTVET